MTHERKLAYLLRHDSDYQFDSHGWREVRDLVENHGFSLEELKLIVATNNKQRFEFSDDGHLIRARQGHSVDVDVELEEAEPPKYLFHGTIAKNVQSIMEHGLCRLSRQYVHLSADIETALQVGGRRRGKVVILKIMAQTMMEDGYSFWLSRNNVWLAKSVPPKYIEQMT